MVNAIGEETKLVVCKAITGSGTNVTFDPTKPHVFIKAKQPQIGFKPTSRIQHQAMHRSRINPDLRAVQSYSVPEGKYQAKDHNKLYELFVGSYFNRERLFLLVDLHDGTNWTKKLWYNQARQKVYYLKGVIKDYKDTQEPGKIWKIQFNFEEVWTN